MKNRLIAVDFDGTCVVHEYPKVGRDIGAAPVLNDLVDAGHFLILWTMRSGRELEDAKKWFRDNAIPLHAANVNPDQKKWTDSPKVFAHIYIDDAGLGAPLCKGLTGERPFLDWEATRKMLVSMGLLEK